MTVYENLQEIADCFEVFLFDAYGVFWNGSGFYKNSKKTMQKLVQNGKIVVVVSNSTLMHADMLVSYERKGMQVGREYNFMVSSGEVLRKDLLEQRLTFASCANPLNYFVIGSPNEKLFADTKYKQVENLEEADFVFCGVPFLNQKQVRDFSQYQADFYPAKADKNGEICCWDTAVLEPFVPILEKAAKLRLPVLNANPDFMAQEGHQLAEYKEAVFVVRNGSLAEFLRQKGNEVLEYGKPHQNIYDYVFDILKKHNIRCPKSKICMIGDTVRTDIKGALNARIAPVLCLETGITARETLLGNSLENLCENEKIDVQQIIKINSVGGR